MRGWLNPRVTITVGTVLTLLAAGVRAGYIQVPTDQPTIQAGIDAAADGDTVLVSKGTYAGPGNRDIDFKGKRVFVDGVGGPENTIIDCGGTPAEHHGGFIFHTAEDSTSQISGLMVRNAYFTAFDFDTGAIMIVAASPRIWNCRIESNHANGITIRSHSAPRIEQCEISHNDGWGVSSGWYPEISGGWNIRFNVIDQNGLGGIIVPVQDQAAHIDNNTLVENGGHGIALSGEPPMQSQGIAAWDTNVYIQNNIVAFNRGAGIIRWCCWFPGLHFYRNDLFGNTSGDWLAGMGADSVCLISVDPLFCRAAGFAEYSLQGSSPCLAANNVCAVDMGALGVGCTSCCIGMLGNVDCDPENVIDISDLSRLIDYLYISFERLCCPEAANVDGVGPVDIGDLTRLIDYLYISLNPPGNCQ